MLSVTVQGQQGLIRAITALDAAFDPVAILDEGAAVIYNRLRSRFLIETNPQGQRWPPSQAALRRARTGRGGGTLFDTGKLFRSLQLYAPGADTRAIGTNVTSPAGFSYPYVHNFGIGFPQRQFLGFADEDLAVMQRVIQRRIVQAIKLAQSPTP